MDRQIGSALHRHNSILAMVDAMEHIQKSSTTPATSAAASIAANLADLSSFLTRHFINVDADAGDGEATTDNTATMLLAACSDAVALNFPWKRVQELAKLYCKDFSILQRRLDRSTIMVAKTPNISAESSSPASTHQFEKSIGPQKPMQELLLDDDDDNDEPLVMEECLAAFLGQAIRYQLRLLLNTAPPRLCKEDEEYEVRSLAYSQVCKLAILVPRSDASPDNAAAEDSFFSAIVSNALDHIFEYFGMEQMVGVDELVSSTIVPLSVASQRSLTLRNVEALKTTPLAEEDVDAVLQDIRDATSLLDVSRAVKFIIDLFNAPGVQDEIQRMSGWSPIESYATWSLKYSSWKLFPADSHLVALHNVKLLLQRLQAFYIKIASTIDDSEGDLQTVRKNYFVVDNGLAAARRSKACKAASEIPPLVEISKTWNEGMTRARYFPLVAVPKQVKRKPQK